jgi:hypothetical protein
LEIDDLALAPSSFNSGIESLTSMLVVSECRESSVIVMGTRGGNLITIEIRGGPPFETMIHAENLGFLAVNVFPVSIPSGGSSAFACCDSGLVLLTDYGTRRPGRFNTKHRVWPTNTSDSPLILPPVNSVVSLNQFIPSQSGYIPVIMLAGTHILLAEIHLWPCPVPRHLPVAGTPTKIIYSHSLECLIVALRVGDTPRLAFLNPDTGADLSRATDRNGETLPFISGFGTPGDRIHSLCEWLYSKDGKTWLFIIATTAEGRLLIISTEKEHITSSEGSVMKIRYWTRYKKKFTEPVYSVVGDDQGLIYCVGRELHWEILDLAEKKLRPKKKFDLDSPATSIKVVGGKLYVITIRHSVLVIDHGLDSGQEEMSLLHCDPISRLTVDLIDIGSSQGHGVDWPITLLSDRDCGFAGVWVPWKQPGKDLQVIFEGELPASVRKFRRGRPRPPWVADQPFRYGRLPSTVDGAEILGACVDGSILHFTIVSMEAWRLFRLIQNIAITSPILYPFTFRRLKAGDDFDPEPEAKPKRMLHIDGDMLQRCYDKRALETLISDENHMELFREYLDKLDDGQWTADFQDDEDHENYFKLAYKVLEDYLAPVL